MLVSAMNSHDQLEREQNLHGELFAWIPTEINGICCKISSTMVNVTTP